MRVFCDTGIDALSSQDSVNVWTISQCVQGREKSRLSIARVSLTHTETQLYEHKNHAHQHASSGAIEKRCQRLCFILSLFRRGTSAVAVQWQRTLVVECIGKVRGRLRAQKPRVQPHRNNNNHPPKDLYFVLQLLQLQSCYRSCYHNQCELLPLCPQVMSEHRYVDKWSCT